jgi:hypothetical protein
MAANYGTIPNQPMDGPARADALQTACSAYLKTYDFKISRQDLDTDVSGHFRCFAYGYGIGSPNQVNIRDSAASRDFFLTQACGAFHERRSRGLKIAAFKACCCVEDETLPWVARWLKKASI